MSSINKAKEAIRQSEHPYKSIEFAHAVPVGDKVILSYMVTDLNNNNHTDSVEV